MYVKVTAGEHLTGAKGDFIIEVKDGPIYSDYAAVVLGDDAKWDDGNLVDLGHTDFSEAMGCSPNTLHTLEFLPDQTKYEKNKGIVAFRYAYWHNDEGITAVITTRNIFIVGANGKTIDRV